MRYLYVLGGSQRASFKNIDEEWLLFEKAIVGRVDTETGEGQVCLEYETPLEARATERSSVLFKAGAIENDRLYLCTSTEIMVFQVPEFRQIAYISLPFFNDLHYVRPTPQGTLLAVITGLDMVAEVTLEGKVLNTWSVLGDDPWQRFSRDVDYRRISTLKPYRAHPNFVFWSHGDLWVSRCDLHDAVSLAHPERKIDLGIEECIHDGVVFNGRIYFTAVDGHLIIANEKTLQVELNLDLKTIGDGDRIAYSWCRGVLPVDDRTAWVGFTRIRHTRWKEKVLWVKNIVRGFPRPTCIALYDHVEKKLLKEIDLEPLGMNAIFNAVPAPLEAPREGEAEPKDELAVNP